ncbi:FAD:protein FMN transferase [Massilia cavernae]|uniref:FAD:protein FMN transferase n=1 Tax=Massilia cavernae TaxID=2320864 RepID=A0A418XF67_9BURK|nr:FAD:protein FMN transferase [Massilia cavernae]RJG11174.1 FAD:protein FMN transferase [Massilia cavernae]
MRRRTFIAASLGTIAGGVGAVMPGQVLRNGDLHTGAALAFGTTVTVSVVHQDTQQAELAIEDALAEASKVDALMSIYSESSQVFKLNRDGLLEKPDPHLLAVLAHARGLSRLTKGAFDITVQPLWLTFREAALGGFLPPAMLKQEALDSVGWEYVDAGPDLVKLRQPGMAVTLNGLAQGYAADLALAAVRARGVRHALIDTGEFLSDGALSASGRPWTLGVADPREQGRLASAVRLVGRGAATSGDYESSFTPDFVHHHIFDPVTGDSPQELASVTVLAPTGIEADGLSTAFMVMGARKAHALAARLPGVDLMTINKRGIVWKSPSFPAA